MDYVELAHELSNRCAVAWGWRRANAEECSRLCLLGELRVPCRSHYAKRAMDATHKQPIRSRFVTLAARSELFANRLSRCRLEISKSSVKSCFFRLSWNKRTHLFTASHPF